jgi:glycosyltransferase involved in cell wall biosynthesis
MYGGPLRVAIDLSSHSRCFGLESEIVGLGSLNVSDNDLSPANFHNLPLGFPSVYRYSRGLRPWLAKNLHRFNGVIMHGLWLYPSWAAYLACREAGVSYAYFPHGMLDPWAVEGQGLLKRLKKTIYWYAREEQIFKNARCIFFTTQRERNASGKTFPSKREQRIVIPYGIATPSAKVSRPLRPELTMAAGDKTALFLGRVHPKKNVHFLLKAWIKANIPANWKLVIAGPIEPIYRTELTRLAEAPPCRKSISFVGPVTGEDKRYLLQNSSWFLLPSKQENFGVAVLEAISHGCPVAISNQVYLATELHSRSEILNLDENQWIEFFERRMTDETWRQRLCELDREFVLPKFAIKNIARSWTQTLNEVFVH